MVAEGICRDIVKRYLPACDLITSPALLDELAKTMREKFGLNPEALPLLKIYADSATIVKSEPLPHPVCHDEDDDELPATALAGEADTIVSGDKDLLILKEFQGVKILSPRQFVEWMDGQK